jgi:hypothetical protein
VGLGNWLVGGAYALAGLGLLWTAMAWRSGQFIPHDGRWAVAPGEVTRDGFAHQKKTIKLPSATIAYVDVGQAARLGTMLLMRDVETGSSDGGRT